MRVLMTSWAAASHFRPLVPLAWALLAAGHEVRLACQPSLVPDVTAAGLHPVVTGGDIDVSGYWRGADVTPGESTGQKDHEQDRTVRALRMFTGVAAETTGEVVAFAREWGCDLVVYEPRAYAGLIAAELLGVPAVRHLFGVDFTYWRHGREHELLSPLWARFGLGDVDPHGTLTVDPFPPSLQIRRPLRALPVRPISYNGREIVSDRPADERPRVCVTWGTTFARSAGHLQPLMTVLDGLRALPVTVVVAVSAEQRSLLGEVPANVRVVESTPLSLLLPTCDAIVHQGGPGTALAAINSGIPQLLIPSIGDQPLCAEQVAAAGAGRVIPFGALTAGRVRKEAAALLGEALHTEAAERLRHEARTQPAPAALMDALRELAGR
ncbi:nucleotide disphospho-sugar-binding domain-containing protein [Nonomuraea glycinis]|uniref:nucleotide disphospho-sugar-binding domain-containing protein n=1 Tax=Nonomuraea glycinis TaxID=2047744 RepID=UPI0033A1FAA1